MTKELLIYPQKCTEQASQLEQMKSNLETYKERLETVKNAINGLGSSGYGTIISTLNTIAEAIGNEVKSTNALKEVLEASMKLYIQTEARISATELSSASDADKIQWGSVFGDVVKAIADLRNEESVVFLESLLTKGILGENALSDLKKILSGTYISSYWENGSLKLRLNSDGFTNSQAADWLRQNLGGTWDDFRARNMNGDGFCVYDPSRGSTRQMRYFENITDSSLAKYLKQVESNGRKNWLKAAKEAANVFEDFDYSKFSQLDNLGKASKVMGTLGTVLTVSGDVVNSFYDPQTKQWSFSGNQVADCAVDVVTDLLAGSGSAAAGAAAGTVFAPPVGTVVGAGVGIFVDVVANNVKLIDVDGDGNKDSAVDTVKILGHWAVDQGEKAVDAVADWGADAIEDAGKWFKKTFSF